MNYFETIRELAKVAMPTGFEEPQAAAIAELAKPFCDEITTDTYELERPASDVHDYYRNICKTIQGEATQLVTHEQMMRVLRVLELGFESAAKKQVITLENPL